MLCLLYSETLGSRISCRKDIRMCISGKLSYSFWKVYVLICEADAKVSVCLDVQIIGFQLLDIFTYSNFVQTHIIAFWFSQDSPKFYEVFKRLKASRSLTGSLTDMFYLFSYSCSYAVQRGEKGSSYPRILTLFKQNCHFLFLFSPSKIWEIIYCICLQH